MIPYYFADSSVADPLQILHNMRSLWETGNWLYGTLLFLLGLLFNKHYKTLRSQWRERAKIDGLADANRDIEAVKTESRMLTEKKAELRSEIENLYEEKLKMISDRLDQLEAENERLESHLRLSERRIRASERRISQLENELKKNNLTIPAVPVEDIDG